MDSGAKFASDSFIFCFTVSKSFQTEELLLRPCECHPPPTPLFLSSVFFSASSSFKMCNFKHVWFCLFVCYLLICYSGQTCEVHDASCFGNLLFCVLEWMWVSTFFHSRCFDSQASSFFLFLFLLFLFLWEVGEGGILLCYVCASVL